LFLKRMMVVTADTKGLTPPKMPFIG
jgi:hypothetical protein